MKFYLKTFETCSLL